MDSHQPIPLVEQPDLWIGLSFVIFIVLAARYLWPMIGSSLDQRGSQIRDQLEQAARLREEAQALLASYEKERADKLREAESIVANAKAEADELRERAATELKQALDRRSQQAQERIARAETDALVAIRSQMVETATNAARDVITSQLANAPESDPSIANAVDAISRQIH
jgi:F-type H+-transporting ATPase subunit b